MRNLLRRWNYVLLFSVALFCGCSDEDLPLKKYPYVGTWHFQSDDTPLQFEFEITQKGQFIDIQNQQVIHPLITTEQGKNVHITLWDEFKNEQGFGRIEIVSRSGDFQINLVYNLATDGYNSIEIYEILIDMNDAGFTQLKGQYLDRGSLK
jgi:hypothetical protein